MLPNQLHGMWDASQNTAPSQFGAIGENVHDEPKTDPDRGCFTATTEAERRSLESGGTGREGTPGHMGEVGRGCA